MQGTARAAVVLASVLLRPVAASAQSDPPPVHISIGALGGSGLPGPLGAVRLGVIGPRVGLDVDVGRLASSEPGNDRFIAVQVRVLTRRRTEPGWRLAWFVGANHRDTLLRTEVRWPGGVITVSESHVSGIAGQFGVGGDWLGRHGRAGIEFTSGAGKYAGPRMFVKLYVAWTTQVRTR